MCEFKASLEGKTVHDDVISAKLDGNSVVLRDVLGRTKVVENCKIVEVDVGSERLTLAPA